MPINSYMNDENKRLYQLACNAKKLSVADIANLDHLLAINPEDMDLRIQLFAYYNTYEGNSLKHENGEQLVFEQVRWLISNKPELGGYVGHKISMAPFVLTPEHFLIARNIWLEQVNNKPNNADILGNAGAFISWNDFETGSELTERAYSLEPFESWLGTLIIQCHSQIDKCRPADKEQFQRRVIDIGLRSLATETGGAPFLTAEYMADAALALGQFDLVKSCAQILIDCEMPAMANAYCGLVVLRENDRKLALKSFFKMKPSRDLYPIEFAFAKELLDAGEKDLIVQFISNLKGKIKKSWRERWLKQIAENKSPDFEEYFKIPV